MERIIKDFRIANNLSLMETVRGTPFHAGHCPDMELGFCDPSSNRTGVPRWHCDLLRTVISLLRS